MKYKEVYSFIVNPVNNLSEVRTIGDTNRVPDVSLPEVSGEKEIFIFHPWGLSGFDHIKLCYEKMDEEGFRPCLNPTNYLLGLYKNFRYCDFYEKGSRDNEVIVAPENNNIFGASILLACWHNRGDHLSLHLPAPHHNETGGGEYGDQPYDSPSFLWSFDYLAERK